MNRIREVVDEGKFMLEKSYEEIRKGNNVRENLSLLRNAIKQEDQKKELLGLIGDGQLFIHLLSEEEPKTRKNAALLLGDLGLQQAAEALFTAYERETTLFVRSAYLTALKKLDASAHLKELKERLAVITAVEPKENEKKHIREEIRELEAVITGIEGIARHTFRGFSTGKTFLLTTNALQREVTAGEIAELSASVRRSAKLHPLGVLVRAVDIYPFTRLRTYRELLFPLKRKESESEGTTESGALRTEGIRVTDGPKAAAQAVWESDLWAILEESHKQAGPFYFRLEIKCGMEFEKRGDFARSFCAELEHRSGRLLINSPGDYELEIRLLETKDGRWMPYLKLYTIPMKRFFYRKHAVASSIHPAQAAMLIRLARPYLKENAQILDPFCGVGTMLIERDISVPAREKYGIDIFGDAIVKARENAALAGEKINFIHRDYFDFRHDYLFDEIITNMPVRGKKTKEEMDQFYASFFSKSEEIMNIGGIIVLYSNESGFIKKQLRLNSGYKLLQEFVIREKDHFHLFIIRKLRK